MDEPTLTETEIRLLRAMARVRTESTSRKSVVVLRYALLERRSWDDDMEAALCSAGTDHPLVAEYYTAIRRLVRETDLADGAGNLDLPAGPRYTECWITQRGLEFLTTVASRQTGR